MSIFINSFSLRYHERFCHNRFFQFELQRFSPEKTEEPTQRRQEEARQKGQVAKSVELTSVFVILAAFVALKTAGPYIYDELSRYMRYIFTDLVTSDFTIESAHLLLINAGIVFLTVTIPIMVAILAVSILVNFLQVGFAFTPQAIMPQFSRIDPIAGFGRIFSKRSLVELVKSVIKIIVVIYFIFRFLRQEAMRIPGLIQGDLFNSFVTIASMIFDLAIQIGLILLIMALMDYFYQWWEHMQSMKMTKQEVKEEMQQTEGNPQTRAKIRERQRAMSTRRMMQEVPKADVVVTNPTHFAVALQYDENMAAPVVLAKGQDFIAQRIKEIAVDNDVTIVENKPLAQALFQTAGIGDVIPPALYQAVAEVLAYVYRLKRRYS